MSNLRLLLFGTPRLECDGTPVKITRRKVTALLAYLAVTGQPRSREALATLLWPDTDATGAYAYLRNALWMVKQTPVADWLEAEQDTLELQQDHLWVDVVRFEANLATCRAHPHPEQQVCADCLPLLKEAVALYQGDFMSGFTLEDSADFDEWQFFQAEALRRALNGALEKLVLWHSQHGPLETALDYARLWQSRDPLNESVQRHLMTLYARLNQRAAALRLYETLIRDLRAQGLAPAEETVALYQRIRAGEAFPALADSTSRPISSAAGEEPRKAPSLPAGTVTYLFTDIQGSVALWDQHPDAMKRAVANHHAILRQSIESQGGIVFKIVGDAFQAAFVLASQALAAGIAAQQALCRIDWDELAPLCVRMGLHTGPAELVEDGGAVDYAVSHTLNRAARVMSAGHGGQILLSQETAALVQHTLPPDIFLLDLGDHLLKGLAQPEHLFQIVAPDLPQDFPPLATGVKPRHNLPVQPTAFVGRVAELAELHRLLADPAVRLVTLTGTGGIGKTRLSQHVAEEILGAFPDGVFFVPLAAAETPESIVSTLADVLGLVLYQQSVAAPFMQLAHHLHDKRMLLVLDNLEQVLSGAPLIAELVQHTQALKILITSRERLNVQGEWVLELQGLRFPGQEPIDDVETYGAVRLFLERAARINHNFAPDADALAAVVRICRLVQGMPLGLELAAAWTRLLSCAEIADEIAVSLDFLTLSLRDMPERHRSLRAVFAHSWNLLSREERACYCALSVFRGGFTRAAAVEIAGASLPLLASLMDKSMLYRATSGRYEILEVLRQYAEEQLAASPEQSDAVRDRHSDYYLGLLHELEPALKGPGKDVAFGQLAALDVIQQDLDNVRAAWRRATARGKATALHQAAFSLGMFCDIRSRFREGVELFGEAAATFSRPGVDVAPEFLGLLLGIQGEYLARLSMPECLEALRRSVALVDTCPPGPELALVNILSSYGASVHSLEERERRLRDSLAIYEARHDLWGMALVLTVTAETLDLILRNDLESAGRHVRQALDLQRRIGDRWGTAISLFTLGMVHEVQKEFLEARQCYQESLDVRYELKDMNGAGACIHNLGRIAYHLGDLDGARALQLQSLETMREVGAPHGIPDALQALAEIAYSQGNLPEARAFLIEACAGRRSMSETSWQLAYVLLRLGDVTLELAEVEAAEGYFRESLALFEKLGHAEGRERARGRLERARVRHA
jgi:predicted ATPase/class 3 adenylate cyclase